MYALHFCLRILLTISQFDSLSLPTLFDTAVYARLLAALIGFAEGFPAALVEAHVDVRKFALPALVDAPLPVQEATLRFLRASTSARVDWFQAASSSGGAGVASVLQIALAAASAAHYPAAIGVRFATLSFAVIANALAATGLFADARRGEVDEPRLWLHRYEALVILEGRGGKSLVILEDPL